MRSSVLSSSGSPACSILPLGCFDPHSSTGSPPSTSAAGNVVPSLGKLASPPVPDRAPVRRSKMSAVTAVPEVMAGCRDGSGGYRVDARRGVPDGGAGDLAVLPAAAGEVSTAVAQVGQVLHELF